MADKGQLTYFPSTAAAAANSPKMSSWTDRRTRFDVRYECALRVHLASQMQPSIQTIKYAAAAIAMCVRGAGEQMRRRSDIDGRADGGGGFLKPGMCHNTTQPNM